jgi:AraC family cel operon transcriptional repressor
MKYLKIGRFVRPPQVCHFTVVRITDRHPSPVHTHDFFEVFWVLEGRGWHHVNGRNMALRPGDMVLIRPSDRHSFSVVEEPYVTIGNLAFSPARLATLARRYGAAWRDGFRPADVSERVFDLSGPPWRHLAWATEDLHAGRRDAAALERFLLNLQALSADRLALVGEVIPVWLSQALVELKRFEIFRGGTQRFVKLCGYSPEYVARSTRRWLRRTPTELVNEARMNYAAEQLTGTREDIVRIAWDCGFSSLSHFYQVFRRSLGVSPNKYRRQQPHIVGVNGDKPRPEMACSRGVAR